MYPLHQAQEDLLARLRPLALDAADLLRAMDTGRPEALPLSQAAASLQLLESAGTTHRKPPFGLTHARVGDKLVEVREEVVDTAPFGRLLRFAQSPLRWKPPPASPSLCNAAAVGVCFRDHEERPA